LMSLDSINLSLLVTRDPHSDSAADTEFEHHLE
jgi:hypothetical protein